MRTKLSLAEAQPIAVRAALVAAVTALVHIAVVAGLVDPETETAIGAGVDAVGALVLVLWSIRSVTPNAKVAARVTSEGTVVAGDASTVPTGAVLEVDPQGTASTDVVVPIRPDLAAA